MTKDEYPKKDHFYRKQMLFNAPLPLTVPYNESISQLLIGYLDKNISTIIVQYLYVICKLNYTDRSTIYSSLVVYYDSLLLTDVSGHCIWSLNTKGRRCISGGTSVGTQDDVLARATYTKPGHLCEYDLQRFIVIDEGSECLRLVDLKWKRVTSICYEHDSKPSAVAVLPNKTIILYDSANGVVVMYGSPSPGTPIRKITSFRERVADMTNIDLIGLSADAYILGGPVIAPGRNVVYSQMSRGDRVLSKRQQFMQLINHGGFKRVVPTFVYHGDEKSVVDIHTSDESQPVEEEWHILASAIHVLDDNRCLFVLNSDIYYLVPSHIIS